MNITIHIENQSRAERLIEFLKELPYLEIKEEDKERSKNTTEIKNLFGLWKNRDVSIKDIRGIGWQRKQNERRAFWLL